MSNEQENYSGITDGITDALVDSLFKKIGLDEKTTKKIEEMIHGFVNNVEVKQIGDETIFTVNLNKLHITFKK